MSPRDDAFLYDMLLESRRIARFLAGIHRQRFLEDEVLQYAVVRAIGIVGEAAARVSEDRRATHPEVPWRRVIGMRHRLVHDYRHVDVELVWDVATRDIPALAEVLERIAPDPEADPQEQDAPE